MKSIIPMAEMVAQFDRTGYISRTKHRPGGCMKLRILYGAALLATVLQLNAWAATPCESLAGMSLTKAKVTSASAVAAGAFVPPSGGGRGGGGNYATLPAFCRVTATLTPSSDSDIKIELWLPQSNWNGKFEAVGNGGWAGSIPYPAIAAAMRGGYAAAGTDTGHTGNNADFAFGHPEKLIDLAYRSIHEMTVQSKALLKEHYGSPAKFSYYNGCSQGGRQALAEAQRYPSDFDGIIAGASAVDQMRMHGARTALNILLNKSPDSVIPPAKYSMINKAVLNACDALDGVKDGVIEDPMKCKFDYASLLCKAGDSADCLTKGQVESAKTMTSPLKDPKTGKTLFEGYLIPGSELGWATLGGPEPLPVSISGLRNIVFGDRSWDYHTMELTADVDRSVKSDKGGAMATNNPDLQRFFDRGGKLLMYHGWSDPQVTPMNSVLYYKDVLNTVGKGAAGKAIALFMVPGMNHCTGGPGTDTFDKVKVMEDWVEKGMAPKKIIASHQTNGAVDKTRPLCPYPQVAKYNGSGDTNDAANFSCK
jgi:feruloyl esterase